MAAVYFRSDNTNVFMDSETSIDVSKTNTVATSSVVSNKTVSDNVQEGRWVISVAGIVSYSKTPAQSGNPTPSEWVDLIENSIRNKERFTLYSTKYQGNQPLLKDYPNMVISDYGYIVDKYENAITTRITFQEVFVSDAATQAYFQPVISSEIQGLDAPTTGGKGNSTAMSTKEVEDTLGYASKEVFVDFLSN